MLLQNTVPAYLFREYADDDNLQAFWASYNAMAQAYQTWFATVGLPYYPGLSGALLDWVALGLYGSAPTALESQTASVKGPLNTEALDTAALNTFSPAAETFYNLTDDAFQRIITWNAFKGDGKRFSMPWLKRRVMRFLVGANGQDPTVVSPGQQVGTENTSAISARIAAGVCTVNINQALASVLVPNLPPNLLTIFQAAFQAGPGVILDLPAQYTYVCNVQTTLNASVVPATESSIGSAASQTTGAAAVSLQGGSGSYHYAWTWQSGGAGITINSPTAASTSFTASGLASGTGVFGTALCTVTDTVTSLTAHATVAVSIERATPVAVAVVPTSISQSGASASLTGSITQVTASGGLPPYTYAWSWQSGGAGIEIDTPTSALTNFTAGSLSPGTTDTGTALLTVTDSFGQQATAAVPVSLGRATLLSAVTAPTSISVTAGQASIDTGTTTVTPSGGQTPYAYAWSWQSGGGGMAFSAPTAATTYFGASGLTPGEEVSGVAACVVTDAYGQTATVTCAVSITRATLVSASASPASQSSVGVSRTQTTGTSTVSASGGEAPYTYGWTWSSGGSGIAINSPSAAATSFTAANMNLGTTYSGVAVCTVTDNLGQTAQATVSVSIKCAALVQAYTNEAAAAFTIPTGASEVTLEGWGPGGAGAAGSGSVCGGPVGAGGGAGGYFRSAFSVTSANWGQTINISATNAAGAAVSISSGTYALSGATAHAGAAASGNSPGSGGTASGGNALNATGGAGAAGNQSTGAGGAGGTPHAGVNGGPYGTGGKGGGSGNHPAAGGGALGGVVVDVT